MRLTFLFLLVAQLSCAQRGTATHLLDSLQLISVLEHRRDSLYEAGQSVKGDRVDAKIRDIDRRLYGPGREHILTLYKDSTCWYSTEMDKFSINDGQISFFIFRLYRGQMPERHIPRSWVTEDAKIEAYESVMRGQVFEMRVRFLPTVYTHKNNKGAKCSHGFNGQMGRVLYITTNGQ